MQSLCSSYITYNKLLDFVAATNRVGPSGLHRL